MYRNQRGHICLTFLGFEVSQHAKNLNGESQNTISRHPNYSLGISAHSLAVVVFWKKDYYFFKAEEAAQPHGYFRYTLSEIRDILEHFDGARLNKWALVLIVSSNGATLLASNMSVSVGRHWFRPQQTVCSQQTKYWEAGASVFWSQMHGC